MVIVIADQYVYYHNTYEADRGKKKYQQHPLVDWNSNWFNYSRTNEFSFFFFFSFTLATYVMLIGVLVCSWHLVEGQRKNQLNVVVGLHDLLWSWNSAIEIVKRFWYSNIWSVNMQVLIYLYMYIFFKIQVRCSHLLVKHNQSRRPSSWREQNITRSKDEALDLIQSK